MDSKTPRANGLSIEEYIPAHLRHMFYQNAAPTSNYAISNGYNPYGFSTDGLVLYLPLWALKNASFKSIDPFGHTFTRTGGVMDGDGFTGDGNDYILKTVANFRSADQTGTIVVWFKSANAGVTETLVASKDEATDAKYIELRITAAEKLQFTTNGTVDAFEGTTGDSVTMHNGSFHMVSVSSDGSNYTLTLDGANETFTGDDKGHWFADIPDRDNISIGANKDNAGLADFITGTIGEVWIYSRAVSVGEMTHIFNCTKFRYP